MQKFLSEIYLKGIIREKTGAHVLVNKGNSVSCLTSYPLILVFCLGLPPLTAYRKVDNVNRIIMLFLLGGVIRKKLVIVGLTHKYP